MRTLIGVHGPVRRRRRMLKSWCLACESRSSQLAEHPTSRARSATHEELLDALLEHISDHVYFKDRDSRFVRLNRVEHGLRNTRVSTKGRGCSTMGHFPE